MDKQTLKRYRNYRSLEKFTLCPDCGERVPLSLFLRHSAKCKKRMEKPQKPKSLIERLKFLKRIGR